MSDMKLADISEQMKEYLKAKIDELETNSNIKSMRDLDKVSMILRRVTSLELI
jgi:hypothetical protein